MHSDDKAAEFTRLWTRCQPRVFAYIHSMVPHWADAEEVLQDTSVVLWQKFDQFDADRDFSHWACGVANFEVKKYRERVAAANRRFSNAFVAMLSERATAMLDEMSSLQDALNHCVEELPSADRQLLGLRYALDATTKSVAAQVHRSVEGVRKSLHRIHRALFECVERRQRQEEHP